MNCELEAWILCSENTQGHQQWRTDDRLRWQGRNFSERTIPRSIKQIKKKARCARNWQRLEVAVRKAMRKASLLRVIAKQIVDNDIFAEEILNQLQLDVQEMPQCPNSAREGKINS